MSLKQCLQKPINAALYSPWVTVGSYLDGNTSTIIGSWNFSAGKGFELMDTNDNYKYICPESGFYNVNCTLGIDDDTYEATDGTRTINVLVNGVVKLKTMWQGGLEDQTYNVAGTVFMDKNDYLQIQFVSAGEASESWFTGSFLSITPVYHLQESTSL